MTYEIGRGAEASSSGQWKVHVKPQEPLTCPKRDVSSTFSRNYSFPIKVQITSLDRGARAPTWHNPTLVLDLTFRSWSKSSMTNDAQRSLRLGREVWDSTRLRDLLTWSNES